MQIHIIGTGDAYASTRANSSILVIEQDYKLLIDCGPTACHQLWKNPLWPELDAVYFTHLHPDHALGLTSLINRFNSAQRRKKLTVYCHENKQQRLQQLVEYGFWSDRQNYPVEFTILDNLPMPSTFNIGPFSCQSATTHHGVTNHSIVLSGTNQRVFYSGDGSITQIGAGLIEKCDSAFIECQAMSLPTGAGHSDFNRIRELSAAYPQVQFWLYHIGDNDLAQMRQSAKQLTNVKIAEQGDVLSF